MPDNFDVNENKDRDRHRYSERFSEASTREDERLQELYGLNLLDTSSEMRFDRFTSLVAELFKFPIVLVSLVDRDRQWFKSAFGIQMRESSKDISFCAHALDRYDVMIVSDAQQDPRFADNPWVTGPPHIRFYAGAVLRGPKGHSLGTLCVIDHKVREFDDEQCNLLRQFGDLVENEIHHSYDLENLRAAVEFSAYFDPLTQLPNRRLLMDRLGKLIELSEVEGRRVSVLLFNIGEMRLINQSFGSEVGDALLIQVSERLRACCPVGGTVARLQADEFIVAFPELKGDVDHIDSVVNHARFSLEQSFFSPRGEHYLHFKIGCCVFPQHGVTPVSLIERASAAIRFPGIAGSGGVRFFSEAESLSISKRLKIESHLRAALEKNQLRLLYQPIVNLKTGRITSVEALLRWHDADLGPVPPSQFIPVAEQSPLIVDLGRWVQREACRQLRKWCDEGEWSLSISINVAAQELLQPDFAENLLDLLKEYRIGPSLLNLEVTEFSLVSDSDQVDRNMALIDAAEVRVYVDDFGTGYSSLAYLRRLPISFLKIDRSFIGGLPKNKHEVTLTHTILSMASALQLQTVAEGVEKNSQLEFLRDAQCDYVQGFFISHPLPADHIAALRSQPLI